MNQRIQEMNAKRLELANEIKAMADIEDWTEERDARWEELNTAYNETQKEIEAALKSEEARKQRLAAVAGIDQALSQTSRTGLQLGRDTAVVFAGGDGETVLQRREARADLCMKAWIRNANRRAVTDNQRQAAAEAQFDFQSPEFRCDLLNLHLARGLGAWEAGGGMCEREFERRVMDIVTANIGTETIPTGFVRDLERAMLDFGGIRRVARIFRTNEATDWDWPTANDTSNAAAILAEQAPAIMTDIPTDKVTFKAFKYQSGVQLTQELLDDNAVGLGSQIGSFLGERLGRGTAAHFAVGNGTTEPQGIINCPLGITAASATAITSDELIDLVHSVDPSYRRMPSTGFIMHDSTVAAIRKLKATDGEYHWQPGLQSGTPDRLLGYPYVVDNDMPVLSDGVGTVVVIFGAMEKFVIRDHAQMRFYRLEELYRGNDLTGFLIFSRHDSRLLDAGTGPIKHLITAAA